MVLFDKNKTKDNAVSNEVAKIYVLKDFITNCALILLTKLNSF